MNRMLLLSVMLYVCAIAQSHDFASERYAAGGADYLKVPIHASPAALGTAVVASRDNLANVQYNPAILDALQPGTMNVIGTYIFSTLDRTNFGFDFAGNAGSYFAYGISYVNTGVKNFDGRDGAGNPTGTFKYATNTITASAAGRVAGGIAAGATLRYINEKLADEGANGFGMDFGATWVPLPYLSLGLCAQNLGSYVWWSTDSATRNQVLPVGRVGVCGTLLNNTLLIETDFIKTLEQPEEIAAGIQYYFLNAFYVRGGMNTAVDIQKQTSKYPDYAFGVGMRYTSVGFDYACLVPNAWSDLGLKHKISLCAAIKNF